MAKRMKHFQSAKCRFQISISNKAIESKREAEEEALACPELMLLLLLAY